MVQIRQHSCDWMVSNPGRVDSLHKCADAFFLGRWYSWVQNYILSFWVSSYFCACRLSFRPCRCGETRCDRMWPSYILTLVNMNQNLLPNMSSCFSWLIQLSAFVPSLVEPIEVSELQVCIFLTINSLRAQYMFHAIFQAPASSVTVFRLIVSEQEKLVEQPHVAKANPCLSNAECAQCLTLPFSLVFIL